MTPSGVICITLNLSIFLSVASTTGQQAASGSGGNQNIIMMVPGAAGGSPTIQRIPLPGMIYVFLHERGQCWTNDVHINRQMQGLPIV